MLKSEAAAYLAGVTQTEGAEASAPTNLHVITGEVGEASADGKTLVKIDGLMFSESDDQFIEVDALGGLEEGDIATIILTGEQGHAMTPLALGSIGSVDRITVRIAAIEADYIKVEQLDAAKARIGELEADHVSVDDFNAATGRIGTLETTRATITDLNAATARIGDLEADHVSTDDLSAATARIGTLETNTADIGTIRANSAKVQNLTAAELEADHATVGSLSTNYAHITNGVIDNATIGYADVNNLSAHYAEIQNGKINSALIDTAAIVDEQVFTVTGNKATLAQIDASKINVLNLKAQNIEVERINGQPVTNKTLVDALSQHESDISGLDTKIDNEVEALNDRIDGAIETFTGTVVPTLENTPASQWNTVKLKDQHVGDVYYVVNSQSAQNGYCYRFTKSGSTYSWQLIKDSDVTAALSRLQTAEGKISNIETFDETVGSFMTNTEDEISSLKTKDTQLETSLGDKVSTSTFNTVSQKVDTNEANITSMSTVLTNNGLTSSTNITNTVNTVKQTADTNKASITNLTQTVNNKADGSTVTTLTNRVSTVEQNLSGITTRVGKTESELDTVSNPNLTPWFGVEPYSTDDGYWNRIVDTEITSLGDGWAHISKSNTSSSTAFVNYFITSNGIPKDLKPSTNYTFLVEKRNVVRNTSVSGYTLVITGDFQTEIDVFSSSVIGNFDEGAQYLQRTTAPDLSVATKFTRGYIAVPAGGSIEMDLRISLYEGEYSGPYKPYVDQTLSNRVKSAETSIEQNSEAIALRATKADVQSLGGNLLTDTDNPVLGSNIAPKYSVVSGGNGTGTIATVTDSPLPNFNKAFRITGNTSGNRDFAQSVGIVYGQNYLFTAYVRGIGGEARALIRVFSGSELFTYSIVVGTDWTPIRTIVTLTGAGSAAYYFFQFGLTGAGSIEYIAPCLSGGAAANSAAELKVANDNINLKVSKNDVINQINVSTEGAKIQASKVEIDGTAVFSAISSDVDDAITDKGYQTSSQVESAITSKGYQTSSQVNSAITSKGYATTTQAQGYASTAKSEAISAAATDATTKANAAQTAATNAANTATDNKLKSYSTTAQANNLYDAKGAAQTVQNNLDNLEIGGRNLFLNSGSVNLAGVANQNNSYTTNLTVSEFVPAGTVVTISCQIDATNLAWGSSGSKRAGVEFNIGSSPYQFIGALAGAALSEGANVVKVVTGTWSGRVSKTFTLQYDLPKGRPYAVYVQMLGSGACTVSKPKLEIGNKATDWTPAPEDVASSIDSVYDRIRSQGIQLVTNGNGFMRDNTNWPGLSFDGSKANGSPGSFTKSVGYTTIFSEEAFPVDVSKEYIFEFDAMSDGGTGVLYSFLATLDSDKNPIEAFNVMYYQNTLTTLASDLNPGDTTVKLTSAANFATTTATHQRTLIFWDYENSGGYTYPAESYSRNVYSNIYADDTKVNKSTGVITLKSAWTGPKKTAGTQVSQGHSGGTYVYSHVDITIPSTWTHYSTLISGLDTVKDGSDAVGKFRQGTAFGKVGFLWNYNNSNQGQIWVTNISVKEASANLSSSVKRTQRIWYRKSASGAPATPGTASSNWVTKADDGNDEWTKMHIAISSTHKYIYTCEQYEMANGTVGYTSVLLDNTITVIDGGNIITGSVTANKLNAADINASKSLTVGAMTDAAASTILNSNVVVGGRNLLVDSSTGNGWHKSTFNATSCEYTRSTTATAESYIQAKTMTFEPGETYTVSCFAKSNGYVKNLDIFKVHSSGGGSHQSSINIALTTTYQRIVWTFTCNATTTEMAYIRFDNNGSTTSGTEAILYIKEPKLEKGNKATDWTPAPEDMATAESLAGTNESLEGAITDIGELSDQLVGTVSEQNKTITTIQTYLNSLRQDLDAEIQSRQQWLNFDAAEGLVIGAKNSAFKTVTTNTSQQFKNGGTVLAETSGMEFVAPVMRSDQILIGNWMWTRRDNGNLSLKWIG